MGNFWTLGVLLFEMCYGFNPFCAADPAETVKTVLQGEIKFPLDDCLNNDTPSKDIRGLCKGLLLRDPELRLGKSSGVYEIQKHPSFRNIDWEALRRGNYIPLHRPSVSVRRKTVMTEYHRIYGNELEELLDDGFGILNTKAEKEVVALDSPTFNQNPRISKHNSAFSPQTAISNETSSSYATPLSRLGSFQTVASNEGSSTYVTPQSHTQSWARGSRLPEAGLLTQLFSHREAESKPDSRFGKLLLERGLLLPLIDQLDWSGRGQHVEFQFNEEVPLKALTAIGYGGSALVDSVLCRRIKLARKIMLCNRRQKLETLINEVEHLQRLRHPHIIQLVGSYLQGKNFAILLYPVADWNLAKFYEMCTTENTSTGFLSHENCLYALSGFFRCLADGLAYIHINTTKHLDIKPQNILVRRSSHGKEEFCLYLADFGISRHFAVDEMSQTDSLIARTRKYCSPEVYDGEARGRAADVFSLGCIFLEMATILCGISLDTFADYRSQDTDGDDSFHANLLRVEEWIEKLKAISTPLLSKLLYLQDIPLKVDVIRQMLSYAPELRPLASVILADLGGPQNCCTREREGYVADSPGDVSLRLAMDV